MIQALKIWGEIINVLRSRYKKVQPRIKYEKKLNENFHCLLGIRQGRSLSSFLFAMHSNDLEETHKLKIYKGKEIGILKLMLLYAVVVSLFYSNQK